MWAFMPVEKPAIERERGVIDGFVEARLDEAGFKPGEKADALTRIRRATFDLTGLPPTPEEVKAFVSADRKNPEKAWEELVDRSLDGGIGDHSSLFEYKNFDDALHDEKIFFLHDDCDGSVGSSRRIYAYK